MKYKTIRRFLSLFLVILFIAGCSSNGGGATEGPSGTGEPISPGGGMPVVGEGLCANSYFPVRQGATWTYQSKGGAAGDYTFTDTVSAVRDDGFTLTSTFEDLTRTQEWECTEEGLVALQLGGPTVATLSSEDIDLQLDVKNVSGVTFPNEINAGDQWQHALDFEGTMVIASETAEADGNVQTNFTVLGEESVTVPAGTFNAMKVRMDTTLSVTVKVQGLAVPVTFSGSFDYWLVQGVGWVKASGSGTVANTSFTETIELQSYNIP